MYSLLFMDADSSITLKDGMSMTLTKPVGTTTLFNYECNTNSTLVILANISLQV
jgi:selenophosphate synthase